MNQQEFTKYLLNERRKRMGIGGLSREERILYVIQDLAAQLEDHESVKEICNMLQECAEESVQRG